MKCALRISVFLLIAYSHGYAQKAKVKCPEKDAVNAGFSFTNRDCSIYSFTLADTSNRSLQSFMWKFGDGTTSAKPAPEHMFPNGTFKVQLVVSGKKGCADTTTKEIVVNKPKADFTYSQKEPGKVSFITKNAKLSHSWDFGDGSRSNETAPVHIYKTSGIFNVELFVQNDFGCIDILYKPVSITLPVPDPAKIALEKRTNSLVKEIYAEQDSVKVTLYDNGEIDGDSVTLIFNNVVIAAKKGLTATPISYMLKLDHSKASNELVMYADNLGSIPPNTALMVIQDGDKRYEINVSSTKNSNGLVRFSKRP